MRTKLGDMFLNSQYAVRLSYSHFITVIISKDKYKVSQKIHNFSPTKRMVKSRVFRNDLLLDRKLRCWSLLCFSQNSHIISILVTVAFVFKFYIFTCISEDCLHKAIFKPVLFQAPCVPWRRLYTGSQISKFDNGAQIF